MRDLLDHLRGLTTTFRNAATKPAGAVDNVAAPGSGSGEVPAANLDPEWRRQLPLQLDELVVAWRDLAAWCTGRRFALNELVLHGWDLARATGLAFECDPAVAEASLSFTAKAIEQGFGDAYGLPVTVPDDAPTMDRLLALTGRDPAWTS